MTKILEVKLRVIVETDLTSPDDILDSLDIDVFQNDENVEVYDYDVDNYQITDAI